jgi:rubrerythrin
MYERKAMPRTIDFATLSLQDALDLAILIEQEAEERYEELSHLVGGRYAGDAADVFRTMVVNESKHGRQLADRRQRLFGDAPRKVDRDMIWEVEAPDYGKPRAFMSARQAYEVALASEQKAFEFFDQAIPTLRNPDVRALFEELRSEEHEHQKMIEQHVKGLPEGPDVEEDEADEPGAH